PYERKPVRCPHRTHVTHQSSSTVCATVRRDRPRMINDPASDATDDNVPGDNVTDQNQPPPAAAGPEATDASPAPARPRQAEMALAMVHGQPVLQIPQDLYIPPDALEVILDAFEGPLDLLLYLIRRQ